MGTPREKHFRYVDLFAGIGGFAAALNAVGGQFLAGAEIDKSAIDVYKRNFGHTPNQDVKDLASGASSLGDFQVLSGGFPCQPFSKSGSQRGTSEERGTLFDQIAEIIRVKKPLIVLLENVKNLVGPKHRPEWDRIIEILRELGYRVASEPAEFSPHLLDKGLGGRPQHRVRVFITATLNPSEFGNNIEEPEPVLTLRDGQPQKWSLQKDLKMSASADSKYMLLPSEQSWIDAWDEWVQHLRGKAGVKIPGFPIWSDFWSDELPADYQSMPSWKQNFVQKNRDFYLENRKFADAWLKEHKVRADFPNSRRKFEWQAGDMQSIWDGLIQFRPSGIRVKKADYIPTLVALNQTPVFGPMRRRLTEREVAAAQGFPRNFLFGNQPISATYKQVGNAVNIGVIAHVFRAHCERDKDVLSRTRDGRDILGLLDIYDRNPDRVFAEWGNKVLPYNLD